MDGADRGVRDGRDGPAGRDPWRGIVEPLPHLLAKVLRALVREEWTARRDAAARVAARRDGGARGRAEGVPRRPALQVGVPRGVVRRFRPEPADRLDHALRVEIVEAMARDDLAAGRVPLTWLTRAVDGPDEEDLPWAAAVAAAAREIGVPLDLVVVTPRSWHDPRTGVGRRWQRVRPERPPG